MFPRISIIVIFCISSISLLSQSSEVLSSDRPGQTYSANTVGQYVLQLQAGGGYLVNSYPNFEIRDENNQIQAMGISQNIGNGLADLRFGLMENFEISGSFFVTSTRTFAGAAQEAQLPDVDYDGELALRYNIYNSSKFQVGAMVAHSLASTAFTARVMGNWNIYGIHNLSSNVFYNTEYDVAQPQKNVGYTLNYALAFEGWGTFIESFGTHLTIPSASNESTFLNYFDAGAWYLISNDLQLDAALGFGNNQELFGLRETNSTTLFAELGLTWRFFAN